MQNSQTPKNFFLQIAIIATLYASAVSFLVFLFSVIDKTFPKINEYYYGDYSNESIRFSISVLIITFPLFIWLGRVYRKFASENTDVKEGKLRRWMIYLTLFITGVTIVIDAIVLVNTFLGGENLATSFLLKVLSVFVVAFSIFSFCLKDLKGYFDNNPKQSKIWSAIVSIVVFISVVGGFLIVGSPTTQRNITNDNIKINDLQSIQWQVVGFYQQKGVLPENLEAVKDPLSGNIIPVDPETKEVYVYKKKDKLTFELCAKFNEESKTDAEIVNQDENWIHGKGEVCFSRTIDPERYPRIKQ